MRTARTRPLATPSRCETITRMNRDWHEAHPMPKPATFEQRVRWHREHEAACGCRRPPADIAAALAAELSEPSDAADAAR